MNITGCAGERGEAITFNECGNAFLVLEGLRLLDQIDLVLQDDDVFQFHDFHRREMLARLRLGTCLVPGHEEEGGVHDRGAVQHRRHENVVARTVDKGDVAYKLHAVTAPGALTGW